MVCDLVRWWMPHNGIDPVARADAVCAYSVVTEPNYAPARPGIVNPRVRGARPNSDITKLSRVWARLPGGSVDGYNANRGDYNYRDRLFVYDEEEDE